MTSEEPVQRPRFEAAAGTSCRVPEPPCPWKAASTLQATLSDGSTCGRERLTRDEPGSAPHDVGAAGSSFPPGRPFSLTAVTGTVGRPDAAPAQNAARLRRGGRRQQGALPARAAGPARAGGLEPAPRPLGRRRGPFGRVCPALRENSFPRDNGRRSQARDGSEPRRGFSLALLQRRPAN